MDFNSANKSNGKRKAQSIQDMINSPSPNGRGGIGRSGYQGPKKGPDVSGSISGSIGGTGVGQRNAGPSAAAFNLNGINVNSASSANRWGNSNEGMPVEKRPRVKSDVPNPMRGNLFKKDKEPGMKSSIAGSGSSYSGPKKSIDPAAFLENATNSLDDESYTGNSEGQGRKRSAYVAKSYSTPIDDYGFPIYCGLLALAVMVTLLASGLKPRNKTYTYPLNVFSMTGVINTAYEHSLGFAPTKNLADEYSLGTSSESNDEAEAEQGKKTVEAAGEGDLNVLGDDAKAVSLDDGTMTFPGYSQAADHAELVSQIEAALAANDFEFVGSKIAYEDENTGSLNGYPLSLVKHFCTYMSTNADKRSSFISTIGSDEYAGTSGTANVIKLPVMKFTVKMGESTETFVLDNTIVSVSGFSDVIVNGNQQAAIYPLLPCMYTVTLTNNAWPTHDQSQEIEATLGEGNLEIKVG